METIKLADGTELVPLTDSEKEAFEADIKVVLDKYDAMYLPVIKEEKSLTQNSQTATLFILKRKVSSVPSPFIDHGESNDTTEETPKAD